MMDKMALVVVEEGGGLHVQVFRDPTSAKSAFDALSGKPTDKPWRVTCLELRFVPSFEVSGASKDLPLKPGYPAFGYRLGHGAMVEPKEDES